MFPLAVPLCSRHYEGVADGNGLQAVGRAVAARRGQLGMTQQDLADAAGVDLKTVYNLESGTRWPIARNRAAVSAALGWEGDALAAMRAGGAPAGADDARRDPPPSTTTVPAVVVDEDELRPYLTAVLAEIAKALARHGPNPSGAQVFADSEEIEIWDNSPYPRGDRARAVAKLRMITDEALHPGKRRAMLVRC